MYLHWEQISLEGFEVSSILFWGTPRRQLWRHVWARGSGSWTPWGASPGSSDQSGGCQGLQRDRPQRVQSGHSSIWFCPECQQHEMFVRTFDLTKVQSLMLCDGTQWNIPVLSYFISVFSKTTLRSRANSVGESLFLWWRGVRATWNSFRLRLAVVSTATSTTGNFIEPWHFNSHWKIFKNRMKGWPTYNACTCISLSGSRPWCLRGSHCSKSWPSKLHQWIWIEVTTSHLLTSSADWAQKYPMVSPGVFPCLGLIEIFASLSSSSFTSIATSSNLSLTKQILKWILGSRNPRQKLTLLLGGSSFRWNLKRESQCTSRTLSPVLGGWIWCSVVLSHLPFVICLPIFICLLSHLSTCR